MQDRDVDELSRGDIGFIIVIGLLALGCLWLMRSTGAYPHNTLAGNYGENVGFVNRLVGDAVRGFMAVLVCVSVLIYALRKILH